MWVVDKEPQYGTNNHYVVFGVWVKGKDNGQILDNFDSAAPTETGQLLKEIAYSYRTASTMVEYSGASTGVGETTYLTATEYWAFYYYKGYYEKTVSGENMKMHIGRSFDLEEQTPGYRAALPLGVQSFYRDACFAEAQSAPNKWNITPTNTNCFFKRPLRMAILESEVEFIRLYDFVELMVFGPAELLKRDSMRNYDDKRLVKINTSGLASFLNVNEGDVDVILFQGYEQYRKRGFDFSSFNNYQGTMYQYTTWNDLNTRYFSQSFVFNTVFSNCGSTNQMEIHINFPTSPSILFKLMIKTNTLNTRRFEIYRELMTAAGTLTDYTKMISFMDVASDSQAITIKLTFTPTVYRNVGPDSFTGGQHYHLVYEVASGWQSENDVQRGRLFNPNNYFVESGYIKTTTQAAAADYFQFNLFELGCDSQFSDILHFNGGASFGMLSLKQSIMQYSTAWIESRRNLEDFQYGFMKDIYSKMELGCANTEVNVYFDQDFGICSPCPTTGEMQNCLICDDKDQCIGYSDKQAFMFPSTRKSLPGIDIQCQHNDYYYAHHEPTSINDKMVVRGCSICPENCKTCITAAVCDTCSAFSTVVGDDCVCTVGNCKVCEHSECDICQSGYTKYVDLTVPPARTIQCQPSVTPETCLAVGGHTIHRNITIGTTTPIHCANQICDLGYLYDAGSTECHSCADNTYGSCSPGRMIQITARDTKYELEAYVSGSYQVSATIVTGLVDADKFYGCDRVDGNNNCVRCLPGFELGPYGRASTRCFCKIGEYYDTGGTRNCVSCGNPDGKKEIYSYFYSLCMYKSDLGHFL